MFNVLPDIFKKEIKSEYYLRRLIVVFAMIVFVEVVFLVSLFPSLVFSAYRQKEISAEMASNQSDAVTKNTSQILQTINELSLLINLLDHDLLTKFCFLQNFLATPLIHWSNQWQ